MNFVELVAIVDQTVVIMPRYSDQVLRLGATEVVTVGGQYARIYGTGTVEISEGYWDNLMLADGLYGGTYWDGNTIPEGATLNRYRWLGTEHESESVAESRVVTAEPYYGPVFGTLFSGPTLVPHRKRDIKNPDGTLTFKGVTDEIHLEDATAFPSPAVADAGEQTAANDNQTGPAETLMRYYVDANLVSSPAARRGGYRDLIVVDGVDEARGLAVAKSPRFQNLLELLQEISSTSPIGFRMVQVGNQIQYQIVESRDLRRAIRLDVDTGSLSAEESQEKGPALTRPMVAGQGEGVDRKILTVTTPQSAAAEVEYGRVIERFVNQSNTNVDLELITKGLEELAENAGGLAAKVLPSDTATKQYGFDWREGDRLTVLVNGRELDSVVTEAVFIFNADAVGVGIALGDVSGFGDEGIPGRKQKTMESRVAYIEQSQQQPL